MDEDPDWLKPRGSGWTVKARRRVQDNPWFTLDDYDAVAPTGVDAAYHLLSFKNFAVGVVPLHEDGTVTLVGQWRFPFAAYSWELPEGGVPKHETPLDGAKRELREEAGLIAADWRHVLTLQLSNSSTDETAFGFLATGFTLIDKEPDATEALTSVRVPFREALSAAMRGRIQDSITVAMLLRVHHMAYEGELPEAMARIVLGQD